MSLKCPASSWNREVLSVFLAAWISREQRGIARRRGQGASHLSRAHIMRPLAALQMTLSLSSCLWASSWLTCHSTSPLLPGLRCTSLPSGTDLQGMPLDTCHPALAGMVQDLPQTSRAISLQALLLTASQLQALASFCQPQTCFSDPV